MEHPAGPDNMSVTQGEEKGKSGELGHYAKSFRSTRTINHIQKHTAQMKINEHRTEYIPFNRKSFQWEIKIRTGHRSTPNPCLLITDQ